MLDAREDEGESVGLTTGVSRGAAHKLTWIIDQPCRSRILTSLHLKCPPLDVMVLPNWCDDALL